MFGVSGERIKFCSCMMCILCCFVYVPAAENSAEHNMLERAVALHHAEKYNEAYPVFAELAKRENPDALTFLGWMHANGAGVSCNITEAIHFYRRAVAAGSREAAYNLGQIYWRGRGVPSNPELAFSLWETAAAKGSGDAQFALALVYHEGKQKKHNPNLARQLLESSIANGNPPPYAFFLLGQYLTSGTGGNVDIENGIKMYERAAEDGVSDAFLLLFKLYLDGKLVKRDLTKAYYYAQKAHQQDLAVGFFLDGISNLYGVGTSQNKKDGMKFIRLAAQKNDPRALIFLGIEMQSKGESVMAQKNFSRALGILNKDNAEFEKMYLALKELFQNTPPVSH